MRLVEMENELKELIEKDVNNPEIYNKIYKLSEYYLNWRKLLTNSTEVEEVATIMAEDLYMKVYKGGYIKSWIGYMRLYCKAAIRVWRKMTSSEIIDVSNDLELAESIVTMSTTYPKSFEDEKIIDEIYFDNIPQVIDTIMQRISRYPKYTKAYMNCKLCILLSINVGRFISYNLDKETRSYARLIYNVILDNILKDFKFNNVKKSDNSLSLLQMYAIENADKDY